MKYLSLCFVALFCIGQVTLFAQDDSQVIAVEADTTQQSLLWKVSHDDLDQPSYVFGTIHMIGKEDYFFTDQMKAAFDESDNIVFEINMEDMTDLSAQMSMMGKVFMSDGKTLRDLLTEEEYEIVAAHFKEMGLPLMFLERMKPMFLSVFASTDLSPNSLQSGEVMSYEMELMKAAKNKKKTMGGLETMEFQMGLFDSIPYDAQAKMLLESIQVSDDSNDQYQQMVQLYKDQNIEAMQSMATAEDGGLEDYESILLTQRNENWIPLMKEMMVEGTTFFAVGAGHLGGEKGVIKLLRKAGYTLEPIR
ncbi:MAG: TraB/GumN family protein [Bacteroidota bacterium]